MLIVTVEAVAASGADAAHLMAEAKALIAATRKEKGCLHYSFATDSLDPAIVRVTERWQDDAAMQGHLAAAHTQAFLGYLNTLKLKGLTAKVYDAAGERNLF